MKLSTVDLLAFIGMFTFGILLAIPFYNTGKNTYIMLASILTFVVLARNVHILFWFVAIGIYLVSWYYIHGVVKRYHKAYELEQKAAPAAK